MSNMRDVRLIFDPSVYVVGMSMPTDGDGDAGMGRFFRDNGIDEDKIGTESVEPARLVETAGRLCYMSFNHPRPGGWDAYIKHIVESRHGSVLEHVSFNMILTGVSRSFTHQLIRHRAGWSYSELSQRYVDAQDVAFVVPPALRDDVRAATEYLGSTATIAPTDSIRIGLSWIDHCWNSRQRYISICKHLSENRDGRDAPDETRGRKAAREAARSVLPECAESRIFATANARAIRHFVETRTSPGADAEMRRVAALVARRVERAAPWVFADYDVPDGDGERWVTLNTKV